MSQQHTPGPWLAGEKTHFHNGQNHSLPLRVIRQVAQPFPKEIALVWATENPEEQANAWLIAAAPDLLAACKRAVRNMEFYGVGSWEVCEQLRAAIARAEGQLPDPEE